MIITAWIPLGWGQVGSGCKPFTGQDLNVPVIPSFCPSPSTWPGGADQAQVATWVEERAFSPPPALRSLLRSLDASLVAGGGGGEHSLPPPTGHLDIGSLVPMGLPFYMWVSGEPWEPVF